MAAVTTVDGYIRGYPTEVQARLEAMRALIRAAAPEAEETLSYGVPAFKLNGKALVNFGAAKSHIGFYPTPSGVLAAGEAALAKYEHAKGSIQFPNDKPLPAALIKKIVKFRLKEEKAKAAAKKKG
jgi:uncharacterized protein YdhG (YjbR/CyaY superfamily)